MKALSGLFVVGMGMAALSHSAPTVADVLMYRGPIWESTNTTSSDAVRPRYLDEAALKVVRPKL